MFGVELMTGAMFFALVNLIIFLVFLYTVFSLGRKIWVFANIESDNKTLYIKKEIFAIGFFLLFFAFFGSLTQPKVVIELPQNRDLIEYQENDEEVIINTPPARTETLEGFTPLKKE